MMQENQLRALAEFHADEVLSSHSVNNLPVDLIQIARAVGIEITPMPRVLKGVSGCLIKKGDVFSLHYSPEDSPARVRFTIAHELGHYFLPGHRDHLFTAGDGY